MIDEADEILRFGNELNFTLGVPEELDGSANRWLIAQDLFRLTFFDSFFQKQLLTGAEKGKVMLSPAFKNGSGCPMVRLVDKAYYDESLKGSSSRFSLHLSGSSSISLHLYLYISISFCLFARRV